MAIIGFGVVTVYMTVRHTKGGGGGEDGVNVSTHNAFSSRRFSWLSRD